MDWDENDTNTFIYHNLSYVDKWIVTNNGTEPLNKSSQSDSLSSIDEGYGQSQSGSSVYRSQENIRTSSQLTLDKLVIDDGDRQRFAYKRVVDLLDYLEIDDERLKTPGTFL